MRKICAVLLVVTSLLVACQKEVSFEAGSDPSQGLLQSDVSGDCLPKLVVGTYEQGTVIDGSVNYIEVDVDVTTAGSYTIFTDTANGVFFRASGLFTNTGSNTVRLRGNRTPAGQGTFNFRVQYDGQECFVPVDFLPAGAGGPATFTLAGAPAACTGADVQGTYAQGIALSASNTVDLNVNVTAIGTYSVTTTATNGITFTGTGSFLTTGPGVVRLTGSGAPTTAGTSTISVTVAATTCTFPVTVVAAGAYTIDCGSQIVEGDYEEGITLTTLNRVTFTVNVTTAGAYSISTATVNGMTFSGSGTLATGSQVITLNGSGTPLADGNFIFTLTGVTPACTFPVNVDPGTAPPTIDWKFISGGVTYQGSMDNSDVFTASPFTVFSYDGSNAANIDFSLSLSDASGGIQNNETYNAVGTGLTNAAILDVADANGTLFEASLLNTGITFQVRVTSHVPANKFVQGTFAGTVLNGSGATVTITGGEFKGNYN